MDQWEVMAPILMPFEVIRLIDLVEIEIEWCVVAVVEIGLELFMPMEQHEGEWDTVWQESNS